MTQVLIIVETVSAETTQMVSALKRTINTDRASDLKAIDVKVISASDTAVEAEMLGDRILCPLTLDLPSALPFQAQALYAKCRDVAGLRKQLEGWHCVTGAGDFWLPIVLTSRGALYGEVIGTQKPTESAPHYTQPIHLADSQRQTLYALGQRLLRSLNASPAVYLMQFGWQDDAVCFDRLFPFPAAPAIASLTIQTPDLFACHWACLIGKPLLDLIID